MDKTQQQFDKLKREPRAGYLIGGFLNRTLTIAEEKELDVWILESEDNMQIFEDMTDEPMVDRFMKWVASSGR